MNDMITYIFSSLRKSERRLDIMSRAIGSQKRFNNQVVIFAGVTALNLISLYSEQSKQKKKIKQLEQEVEELKNRNNFCQCKKD